MGGLSCLCSSWLWSDASVGPWIRLWWRQLCGKKLWEWTHTSYLHSSPGTILAFAMYQICLCLSVVLLLTYWPEFLARSLDLHHCYGLFWPSGLLADWGYCHQTCSVTLAQSLWDSTTFWSHHSSYLEPPLVHLPLQSSPHFLLADLGMGIFRNCSSFLTKYFDDKLRSVWAFWNALYR